LKTNEIDVSRDRVGKLEQKVGLLIAAEHLKWRDSLNWSDAERARVRCLQEKLEAEFAEDYITTGKDV